MRDLLLATNNKNKILEISQILAGTNFKLITPQQIGIEIEVLEDGKTYFENASKKAREFYEASGIPTLADDSGLEVALLNDEPGIHSHRYSPKPDATDWDRCEYLLSKLVDFPRPWKAAFHCEVVLWNGSGLVLRSHGICRGEIIPLARGANGFGYDPIFEVEGTNQTMAELSDEVKNSLSHRARALQSAIPALVHYGQN